MDLENKSIMTVAEVNEYIKNLMENDSGLNNLYVKGEISNFTNHKTGHFYFTVKDDKSVLRAVMFGGASKVKFMPENGMKVILYGRIASFVPRGEYQINCEDMEPDGVGSLYLAYEQLKAKLEGEGLFDRRNKKALPKTPLKIGIITSPTGAAVRDMINVITRRFSMAKIILFPVEVQGAKSPQQLASGIKYFNAQKSADVIIIGRGGGSIEDLWGFNDDNLARVIFSSQIPVISAVGHETDFTICDFVADLRAPTPSAAAELAVPDTGELKKQIQNVEKRMELTLVNKINHYRERIKNYENRKVLKNPSSPIDDARMQVLHAEKSLLSQMQIILSNKRAGFAAHSSKLEALNPLSIVTRGYSVAYSNGKIVKKLNDIKIDAEINIKLSDGFVNAKVTEKIKNKS
jgi:exodeoxyribonuclease VII large subunit